MVQDRGDSQAPSWGFDQQDKARMVAALLQALPEPTATR
jgi:hypothetical protein